jgi:uncharacterized membrane protein
MIYDFSLYTEILLTFMYSIFLRVIQHFDQVPYLSLQFKAAKQNNEHVEGKTEGRIKVTERRRKRRNQLLDDIVENRAYWKLKRKH